MPGVRDGADVLALICEQAGEAMPLETFQVRTCRGGFLYFTALDGIRLTNTSEDHGTDWAGRSTPAPTADTSSAPAASIDLPDGTGTYDPFHTPAPAPLLGWLVERLRPAPLPPQRPVMVRLATGNRGVYLNKAVNASLNAITAAGNGRRNTVLYGAAVALGQLVVGGALNPADTEDLLCSAAMRAGLDEADSRRTIRSGFRAGANRPRKVPA